MPSLMGLFSSFADQQRIERLEQCVLLEKALSECERIHELRNKKTTRKAPAQQFTTENDTKRDSNIPSVRIEDTRAGMKISRFYGWGLTNARAEQAISQMRGDTSFGSLAMYENATLTKTVGGDLNNNNNNNKNIIQDPTVEHMETNRTKDHSNSPCSMERHAIWACRAMALQCAPDLVKLKSCFKSTGNSNPPTDGYTTDPTLLKDINDCSLEMKNVANCVNQHRLELDERMSQD
jgi:hypothetical protein